MATRPLTRILHVFLLGALASSLPLAAEGDSEQTIRGHVAPKSLAQPLSPASPLVFITTGGKKIELTVDEFTAGQLLDPQLADREWELVGRIHETDRLEVFRNYTIKDGKPHRVTYFCEICNIVSHTPGHCACCQGPTELRETVRSSQR